MGRDGGSGDGGSGEGGGGGGDDVAYHYCSKVLVFYLRPSRTGYTVKTCNKTRCWCFT